MDRYSDDEIVAQFADDDEIVVNSLRAAARFFGVTADTVRQWCLTGKLEGAQLPGPNGRWSIVIPKDHPLLPTNRPDDEPTRHYPRVEDLRDQRISALEAENARLLDEVAFLREQVLTQQRGLPDLVERLVAVSRPSLPAPERRSWWRIIWPW